MKKLLYLLTILAFGFTQAQPQKVNYQAVALTAGGQTVKNQAIKLRLSIVDSSATGTVLYTETHQPTTDGAGQFSVFLGGGTATVGSFASISWSNGKDKFLKAEADVTGGTNYTLMGTSQIVSVPYAISAGSLIDSSKVTAQDGTQWSLIVGPNGPSWQQSSGPGGVNMNYPCPGVPTVNYGGQTYNTVQIGSQCWFKENLNVGTMVQGSSNQLNNGTIEKYCYNNLPANCDTFGGLYQWAEMMNYQNGARNNSWLSTPIVSQIKGICPNDWHIPSDLEWCFMATYFDTSINCQSIDRTSLFAGGKLKSVYLWSFPNYGADNSSGFSALPAGMVINNISNSIYNGAVFWSSFEYIRATVALLVSLNYQSPSFVAQTGYNKTAGLSIRCLKD